MQLQITSDRIYFTNPRGETEEQRQTSKLEELESEISLLKQLIQGKRE